MYTTKNTSPRAITTVKSWLSACRISFRTGVGNEADLVVTDASGQQVGVSVVIKDSPIAAGSLVLNGADITSRSLKRALDAFGCLQAALGFEPTLPVDRGAIPERRPYGDDFDLVAMRHNEFRRAPNPTTAQMKVFLPTIDRMSWRFLRANEQLCKDHMLEFDDLKSYAMVWTTNYLGLYAIPAERETDHDNYKLLYSYLSQRFAEFMSILTRKAKNVLPMLDDAFIAMHGRPYDYMNRQDWFGEQTVEEDDEDPEYIKRHRTLNVSSPEARRESATKILDAHLAALPHDRLVEVLSGTVLNDRIHPDARKTACRRLRAHVDGCAVCAQVDVPANDNGEELRASSCGGG